MPSRSRKEQSSQQENGEDGDRDREDGAQRHATVRAIAAREVRDVSAEDVGVSGERFVGLVDGISADDDGSSSDARLGVYDFVSADHGCVARDTAGHREVAGENEDVPRDIAFDLHGAEEAGGVVDLLAGSDEDVLAEVDPVGGMPGRLPMADVLRVE